MDKLEAYSKLNDLVTELGDLVNDGHTQSIKETFLVLGLSKEFGLPLYCGGGSRMYIDSFATAAHWFVVVRYDGVDYSIPNLRGPQPDGEWLLSLSFSTGPYIFGENYPRELFTQFFNEIRAFGPKYEDLLNNSLYFTADKAKDVFDAVPVLYEKYATMHKEDTRAARIAELENEIAKLKGL